MKGVFDILDEDNLFEMTGSTESEGITQDVGNYGNAESNYQNTYGNYGNAESSYQSAYGNYDNAVSNYQNAYGNYGNAESSYQSAYGNYDNAVSNYQNAYGNYGNAESSYQSAYGNYGNAVLNYQNTYGNYGNAESNYQNTYGNYGNAESSYQSAYGNYDNAVSNYQNAYGNYGNAESSYQSAYGNYGNAVLNYQNTYGNYGNAVSNYQNTYGNDDNAESSYENTYGNGDSVKLSNENTYGNDDNVESSYENTCENNDNAESSYQNAYEDYGNRTLNYQNVYGTYNYAGMPYNGANYPYYQNNNQMMISMSSNQLEAMSTAYFSQGVQYGRQMECSKKTFDWISCITPYEIYKNNIFVSDGAGNQHLFCKGTIEEIIKIKEKGIILELSDGNNTFEVFIQDKELGKKDMIIKLQSAGIEFYIGTMPQKVDIFMKYLNFCKKRKSILYKKQPGWFLENDKDSFQTVESQYHGLMDDIKTARLKQSEITLNEYLEKIQKNELLLLLIGLSTVVFPYFNQDLRVPAIFIEEPEEDFVKIKKKLSFYDEKRENSIDIFTAWKKIKPVLEKLQDEILFVNLGNYRKEYDRKLGTKNMSKLLKIAQGETVDGIYFRGTMIFIGEWFVDNISRDNIVYLSLPNKFLEKQYFYSTMMREWIDNLESNIEIVKSITSQYMATEVVDIDLKMILSAILEILKLCGYGISDEIKECFSKEYEKFRKITIHWRESEGIWEEFMSKLVESINQGQFEKLHYRICNDEIDHKDLKLYYDDEVIAIPYKIFTNKLLPLFNMKMKKPVWIAQELYKERFLIITQRKGRGYSQQIWIPRLKDREYCLVLDKKRLEDEYELL